ncbi:MAG TPA: CmcJ/NvfI family oxidoreductase [Thermoanaerobaculia bacterium]
MWPARKRASQLAPTVEAEIRYVGDARVPPRFHADDPSQRAVSLVEHGVRFHDLRHAGEPPSLEREGFTMLPHRSTVTDFGDVRQHAVYCEELAQLLREVTGAPLVFVSPTVVLRSRSHPRYSEGVVADRVADVVHCDRTDRSVWSEAGRALQHYGIDTPPEGRLVSYNLWRTLTPPPQDFPLALCDLRTVREEQLVRGLSTGNPVNRVEAVEFYLSLYDPEQRWCWFSNLTRDEVLVFQQYDSAASGPSGVLHTAFRDPSCTKAAAPRVSVEARAYVFFPS